MSYSLCLAIFPNNLRTEETALVSIWQKDKGELLDAIAAALATFDLALHTVKVTYAEAPDNKALVDLLSKLAEIIEHERPPELVPRFERNGMVRIFD